MGLGSGQTTTTNKKKKKKTNLPPTIFASLSGPAIGASVTSGTLVDAIIASDRATFSTPFSRLGVPPEGCSSVFFDRIMDAESAQRMLGPEGWAPTAAEAKDAGFVHDVVPHEEHMAFVQKTAEEWIATGRPRTFAGKIPRDGALLDELRATNAQESIDLATAFLGEKFLNTQVSVSTLLVLGWTAGGLTARCQTFPSGECNQLTTSLQIRLKLDKLLGTNQCSSTSSTSLRRRRTSPRSRSCSGTSRPRAQSGPSCCNQGPSVDSTAEQVNSACAASLCVVHVVVDAPPRKVAPPTTHLPGGRRPHAATRMYIRACPMRVRAGAGSFVKLAPQWLAIAAAPVF